MPELQCPDKGVGWALPHSRSTVGRWETGGAQEGKAGFTQGQTGAGRWFVTTFSIILSVK